MVDRIALLKVRASHERDQVRWDKTLTLKDCIKKIDAINKRYEIFIDAIREPAVQYSHEDKIRQEIWEKLDQIIGQQDENKIRALAGLQRMLADIERRGNDQDELAVN